MKLMGLGNLHVLAADENQALVGAALSLRAELCAATWDDPDDVERSFPNARRDKNRFSIDLPDGHSVVIVVNYQSQMVLIENAAPETLDTPRKKLKQRKPS